MSEVKALQKRIRNLERNLGRKTQENDILKGAAELGRIKILKNCPVLTGYPSLSIRDLAVPFPSNPVEQSVGMKKIKTKVIQLVAPNVF